MGEKKRRLAAAQAEGESEVLAARERGASAARQAGRVLPPAGDGVESLVEQASALQAAGRIDAAAAHLAEVCRLRPDLAGGWDRLGVVQQALGNTAEAEHAYRRALALEPAAVRRLRLATLVSPIMASRESIRAERERMRATLDALLDGPLPRLGDPMDEALWTNFYLAYHGVNDRELQVKTAEVHRRIFPSLEYAAAHCREPRREGRLRVGLISQFFRDHSIGRTSRGFFSRLSREEFEVTAIFIAPNADDGYSRFIRRHAEHSLDVPRDLATARQRIAALRLDVLFWQDIGMDPFGYFLAFSRLAPVQCVSFGHPDTTGIPAVDWFVSNDRYELPGAQAHYSERLFELHDLGTLAYYTRPELPPRRKTRAEFGLSEADHIYLCPQNLFKFHPDMDELVAGILRRDARGRLVLIEGRIAHWTSLLRQRFAAGMPDVAGRIAFLPRMNGADYVNLIALADVMLDTRHFNGMNTSLEALSQGTPVVTWPGEFQRGRHTQAMYRKIGVIDCVVDSAEAYVELAVRIASDAPYRESLRRAILERNTALFEDAGVVREFERFFREAISSVDARTR